MTEIPQFGTKPENEYKNRPGAYGIIFNEEKKILAFRAKVQTRYDLPGGGIDANEDPIAALIREAREEGGCVLADIRYLGKANQFYLNTDIGPLNKQGNFYTAQLIDMNSSDAIEYNEANWLTPDEFIEYAAAEFQGWAVKMAKNKIQL